MSGINEQFLGVIYKKLASLAGINRFTKPNTFADTLDVEGDLTASSKVLTPTKSELTISSGAITVTGAYHTVDTEGDAASDDLDTINGGSDGMRLTLRANNASRTVALKHNTGNIITFDGTDLSLDETRKAVDLIYDAELGYWLAQVTGTQLTTIPFTKSFESSAQTITAGGTLSLAHGLGEAPKLIQVFLVCQSAEGNYSAGDKVWIGQTGSGDGGSSSVARGMHTIVDDTSNIEVVFATTANSFSLLNKTTGAAFNITNSKWKVVVRAWA